MKHNISLDLLKYKTEVKLRVQNGFRQVFDPTRKKWLLFTPEEMVRQLLITHLHLVSEIPYSRMSLEKGFYVNGLYRRYDIVVHNNELQPVMLIECKASHIEINQTTFDQIFQYNISLRVPYLLVTNGIKNYCLRVDLVDTAMKPIFESDIPPYKDLNRILNEK